MNRDSTVEEASDQPGDDRVAGVEGVVLLAPDGQYLDADLDALDLYGVTLDVLREKRVGDFSPPEYQELERRLWSLWSHSGLDHAAGGGTLVRNGRPIRVWVALDRLPDDNVQLTVRPVDEPTRDPPSLRVQNLLGHWRELERHLADVAADDAEREELEARIHAVREEYQRRVGGR